MDFTIKSGLAEAIDSTMASGNWNWQNDIALWFVFLYPILCVIITIVLLFIFYKLFKWGFMS